MMISAKEWKPSSDSTHTMKTPKMMSLHTKHHTLPLIWLWHFSWASNFFCDNIIAEWGCCRWNFIRVPTHNHTHTDSINFTILCLHKNWHQKPQTCSNIIIIVPLKNLISFIHYFIICFWCIAYGSQINHTSSSLRILNFILHIALGTCSFA